MSKIASLLILLVTVLVCLLPAAAAQAQAARTFVSAAGSDSNNCINVATPCRHLATAYAATAANGEIYVLDPANYGSLTITGPVSIEGHGWASIAPTSGNAAIHIVANAGDKINIIGVVLDGTGIANTTGIWFTRGGSLNVRDSVIRNFTGAGIAFTPVTSTPAPPEQLYVSNTLVSDNGTHGIVIGPGGATGMTNGVLSHVVSENNGANGIFVNTDSQTINVTVSESVSASNAASGIFSECVAGTINIMVRNSTIANNGNDGLEADLSGSTILVTQSTITGNTTGWINESSGVVLSYGDNNIDGNTNANTEPPNPLTYK
jgi:hypothetical protein